ncbi:hypothetical protein RRG08_029184 [Elysia crispata]|uniref:Uncharacterized protein n=1 Tax=Elysia crispata TaxID=231223 RepID=A0AAE1DZR9_9GAST|nr:hypothetical protein RRG08_029184 [Elysia crispata]
MTKSPSISAPPILSFWGGEYGSVTKLYRLTFRSNSSIVLFCGQLCLKSIGGQKLRDHSRLPGKPSFPYIFYDKIIKGTVRTPN